jgi:hypothetical protein
VILVSITIPWASNHPINHIKDNADTLGIILEIMYYKMVAKIRIACDKPIDKAETLEKGKENF